MSSRRAAETEGNSIWVGGGKKKGGVLVWEEGISNRARVENKGRTSGKEGKREGRKEETRGMGGRERTGLVQEG